MKGYDALTENMYKLHDGGRGSFEYYFLGYPSREQIGAVLPPSFADAIEVIESLYEHQYCNVGFRIFYLDSVDYSRGLG